MRHQKDGGGYFFALNHNIVSNPTSKMASGRCNCSKFQFTVPKAQSPKLICFCKVSIPTFFGFLPFSTSSSFRSLSSDSTHHCLHLFTRLALCSLVLELEDQSDPTTLSSTIIRWSSNPVLSKSSTSTRTRRLTLEILSTDISVATVDLQSSLSQKVVKTLDSSKVGTTRVTSDSSERTKRLTLINSLFPTHVSWLVSSLDEPDQYLPGNPGAMIFNERTPGWMKDALTSSPPEGVEVKARGG